jgi:hypothetical protein
MDFVTKPAQSVIESVHYPEWTIRDWKIVFLLSDRLLAEVRKLSKVNNWYEDPTIVDTYIDRVNLCFTGIQKYYATFGALPQVGDRLYNEETGMIIQDRSIDGSSMTITFTLSV